MFPVLFQVGDLTVHTYFFMAGLGFIVAMALGSRRALSEGYDAEILLDVLLIVVFGGFTGARIVYVLTDPGPFLDDPLSVFTFWRGGGGFVWYGGPLLCIPLCVAYGYRVGKPIRPGLDIAACSIPLGHIFGRIGCLGYGCCYGIASDMPWALVFSRLGDGIPRHPTQAYEALGLVAVWLATEVVYARLRAGGMYGRWRGLAMSTYIGGYALLRFTLEFFRGDFRGPEVIFSVSQWISLTGLALALILAASIYGLSARRSAASAANGPSDS